MKNQKQTLKKTIQHHENFGQSQRIEKNNIEIEKLNEYRKGKSWCKAKTIKNEYV